jgi:hypothetical protein
MAMPEFHAGACKIRPDTVRHLPGESRMSDQRGAISMRELYGLALLFACLTLLLARHSRMPLMTAGTAMASTPVPAAVVAPPPLAPEARQALDAARHARLQRDMAQIQVVLDQWIAVQSGASATSPDALESGIVQMQDLRARIGQLTLSSQCAVDAQQAHGDAMDARITYLIALRRRWSDTPSMLQRAERSAQAAEIADAACHA